MIHRPIRLPESRTRHFSLSGLLSEGEVLALNMTLGTLLHLTIYEQRPHLLMEQQFTTSEICLLVPLLESHPHYCPYEVLLAGFTTGQCTEEAVKQARERLKEALEAGCWDQELRPMRNALSRTRFKVRSFGIEIASILTTGYLLKERNAHG